MSRPSHVGMDQLIRDYYKSYGQYVNHSRALPLDIDGLKPVERRVLLAAYQIARDKFVKSARIDGHVIGHYHPHGSAYGTAVQLVNQGFLDGEGNFGCDIGVDSSPPAAMRYTECRLAKITNNMAFKLIDYVEFVESELDKEPAFLPTMFPFCLTGNMYTSGIGFGYRTFIPCYKIEDLKARLLSILNKDKKRPIIRPITNCDIISTEKEIEDILTTGKGTLKLKGRVKIDKAHCKVNLKSWPSSKNFESILNKLSKELDSRDIGFNDFSVTDTSIVFEVLKERNRDEIFRKFLKKLDDVLFGSVSFEIVTVDKDKRVNVTSVDDMLISTYNMFKDINKVMLKSEIVHINSQINENKLLEKIRPSLAKHIKTKISDVPAVIKLISEETKIPEPTVRELIQKYRISKLLTVNLDTTDLEIKGASYAQNLKNIDTFVMDQYKQM
jgi:DNA gyrase/topoisomerase IV subunit A